MNKQWSCLCPTLKAQRLECFLEKKKKSIVVLKLYLKWLRRFDMSFLRKKYIQLSQLRRTRLLKKVLWYCWAPLGFTKWTMLVTKLISLPRAEKEPNALKSQQVSNSFGQRSFLGSLDLLKIWLKKIYDLFPGKIRTMHLFF